MLYRILNPDLIIKALRIGNQKITNQIMIHWLSDIVWLCYKDFPIGKACTIYVYPHNVSNLQKFAVSLKSSLILNSCMSFWIKEDNVIQTITMTIIYLYWLCFSISSNLVSKSFDKLEATEISNQKFFF